MNPELQSFQRNFDIVLLLLLQRWRLWMGQDEIRALNIGFDSTNTEICVSLLTDNEPYLARDNLDPLAEPWPVASWRLCGIGRSAKHTFPDAAELTTWMREQANALEGTGEELRRGSEQLNEELKQFFFSAATSPKVLAELRSFPRLASSFKIRVQWFFEQSPPLDYELARE